MAVSSSSNTSRALDIADLDRAERAEQRADRLQSKLDAERGLTTSLKAQLRAASANLQTAASQARTLHGGPGLAAPAGSSLMRAAART